MDQSTENVETFFIFLLLVSTRFPQVHNSLHMVMHSKFTTPYAAQGSKLQIEQDYNTKKQNGRQEHNHSSLLKNKFLKNFVNIKTLAV